jgi:hypothetical protein
VIHATDTTGEGGGGKSARDGDPLCEGRGWGSLSDGWLKPLVPRSSDITVVPAILQENGVMTPPSPGPGGGGGSPAVWAERESSLADPHGGPAATAYEIYYYGIYLYEIYFYGFILLQTVYTSP